MPNPNDDTLHPAAAPLTPVSVHTTCPSDGEDVEGWRTHDNVPTVREGSSSVASPPHDPQQPPASESPASTAADAATPQPQEEPDVADMPGPSRATMAASTTNPHESEGKDGELAEPLSPTSLQPGCTTLPLASSNWMFPSIPPPQKYFSSFLRPGSKFAGTQESDKHRYNVEVQIKHVDVVESSLCGYLRIEGLAKDHPSLTTFFEGEIIGTKHGFATKQKTWGATEKSDMHHWDRFPAWRPLAKQARKQPDRPLKDWAQREHVFMRWKETFLVPDHRVREISGASFEGFYYICFSQVTGNVSGIYYHARSEKFQRLELKHVPDRGCFPSISFC